MAFSTSRPGIRSERLRGGLHGLLIARRERTQRMLHTVPELTENHIRNVQRVLTDEIDADTLRADEPDDLLDLREQRLWCIA